MRPRPTIRHVAALAGVGLKTVSRVVNGEAGVSDDLRQRVLQAIEQLDYRPNLTASSLRRSDRKTATIGLLLENVANPYSAAVHRAIEDAARVRGITVFSGSLDEDPERERQLATAFVARRVDGMLIVPASSDHSYLLRERQSGLPIVFVDRPPILLDADVVLSSNQKGAAEGVLHMIAGGHRRIAFMGDLRTISTARERYDGYALAMARAGVEVDPSLVRHDLHDSAASEQAALELLDHPVPPSAFFTSQNLVTIGAIRAFRRRDRHREVALVGFDDIPMADLLDPAVTVVAQDPQAIGRLAATLLFRRMDGDRSPSERHVVETHLRTRGSGEIAPAR